MNGATNEKEAVWRKTIAGIEAEALDCVQANLAVLADHHHGAGTHLRLGAAQRFTPNFDAPLPTVDPGLPGHLADAEALLGLRVRRRWDGRDGADLPADAAEEGTLYVVADAYHLPWVPYFQRRHVEHSFLLVADRSAPMVVDAYHVDAPEGRARGACLPFDAEHGRALAGVPVTALSIERRELPATVDTAPVGAEQPVIDAFVAAYRDHPDRVGALDGLCLQTWLLARSRRLHAVWNRDPRSAAHASAWDRMAEQAYLAWRRVARGGAEPAGWPDRLADLLAAETGLFASERARQVVTTVVCELLEVTPEVVAQADSLAEVPGFDSFRMVDMVERVERVLGVELPADELVPENLRCVDRLSALVARRIGEGSGR